MTEVSNIINGQVRAAESRRQRGRWSLPITPAHETAFAQKTLRRPTHGLTQAIDALSAIGREGRWIDDEQLELIAAETGSPIGYMRSAVGRINRWLADVGEYVARFGTVDEFGALRRGDARHHGGLATAMILAGDDIIVAPWKLGAAVLAGCNAIVKPSSVEPLSAFLFAQALIERGIKSLNLLHFDGSREDDRSAIQSIIKNCDQSVVLGEDATVASVYGGLGFLPAHKAIPYWSGRSGAVVYGDADLELAARSVVKAATEDRGNRCISTKKVFAPRVHARRFEELVLAEAERLRRGDPIDPATQIGQLDPSARRAAEAAAGDGEVIYERDFIVVRCGGRSRLICEEVPYPALGIQYYDAEDPVQLCNDSVKDAPSRRCLVVSVFTRSDDTYQKAAAGLRAFKVVRDQPTSELDCAHSHQGMHLFLELMRVKEVTDRGATR